LGIASSGANLLFNMKYQIVLNDIMMFNNLNIVPYYSAMQNVALIEEILVGRQPLRFNQYENKLYVDMDWSTNIVGNWIIIEAYQVVDPNEFTEVWSNAWLQEYATCLIKLQWGNNLKKFGNMALIGGMTFNGQQIYDEALQEKQVLEQQLVETYSLPLGFFTG
jgi:hypothetical protein